MSHHHDPANAGIDYTQLEGQFQFGLAHNGGKRKDGAQSWPWCGLLLLVYVSLCYFMLYNRLLFNRHS